MKNGIVFEGGAFRTVFSCGVMDAFLEHGIRPEYMIGNSAGAAYGISYAAGQIGRNLKLILDYCNDKRYMGIGNLLNPKNRCYYGLKFAYETIPRGLLPFDYDGYAAWGGEFYCVATNVLSGKAEYFPYNPDSIDCPELKATCALPLLFPFIYMNDTPYLDGGLSDSVPYKKAFQDGCDRVVVVLTRPLDYKKETDMVTKLTARAFLKYPETAKALVQRAGKYNNSIRQLKKLEDEGRVIVIRPDTTDGFSRLERDKQKIMNLYDDGYQKGINLIDKVKDFYRMN